MSFSSAVTKKDLLHLYKRLLRACATYPSKNRQKIYESIREDFRINSGLDVGSEKCQKQIHIAYKGLSQLHQFDNRTLSSFTVQLEQNPFPKPDGYTDSRQERVDQILKNNNSNNNNDDETATK
jgi:hypothetical protein